MQRLPDVARTEAAAALRALQVTCPYHRASVQLPIALHLVVSEIHPLRLDPLIQHDWANLQRGLQAHVALLDALEADLPAPVEGDYLYDKLHTHGVKTRAELVGAEPNPVAATTPLLASVGRVVEGYDEATKAGIDAHAAVLARHTAEQWPLKGPLIGWRAALQRMEPFLEDEDRRSLVAQMIAAIDEYVRLYC